MASTGVEIPGSAMAEYITSQRKEEYDDYEKKEHEEAKIQSRDSDSDYVKPTSDSTHRQLRPRHIQLIGIGGTIGNCSLQIGRGLLNGGPGSLFLAFTIWYVTTLDGLLNQEHGDIYMLLPPQSNPFQKLKISCNS
jgi:amino acid transporter